MGVKRKGSYAYVRPDQDGAELGWHSNHSALVIPMAAEKALLEGMRVEDFIINHEDYMDFMLRAKVPKSSRLVAVKTDDQNNIVEEKPLQNICRYYISNEGDGELVKIMPPLPTGKAGKEWIDKESGDIKWTKNKQEEAKVKKAGYEFVQDIEIPPEERRIGIDTGWNVRVCNDIKRFNGNINYDYYIEEAEKLVKNMY